jgi:hypothetical protein
MFPGLKYARFSARYLIRTDAFKYAIAIMEGLAVEAKGGLGCLQPLTVEVNFGVFFKVHDSAGLNWVEIKKALSARERPLNRVMESLSHPVLMIIMTLIKNTAGRFCRSGMKR